jgi:RimJ/RimL family protein N-acetyltransferase
MKQNYETCVVGAKCVLVPYRKEHVLRYHEFMQSPALLEATGSEALSLEEEYEMQQSWRVDEKKCTFIILQRSQLVRHPPQEESDRDDKFATENVPCMVGDVNLFLSEEDVDEEGGETLVETTANGEQLQAEVDIMVAQDSARGQGIGLEAACLMMLYGARALGIRRFFCKINEDNEASISLFRKLNFVECDYAACFKQYEYELKRGSPDELIECLAPFLDNNTEPKRFQCASDVVIET